MKIPLDFLLRLIEKFLNQQELEDVAKRLRKHFETPEEDFSDILSELSFEKIVSKYVKDNKELKKKIKAKIKKYMEEHKSEAEEEDQKEAKIEKEEKEEKLTTKKRKRTLSNADKELNEDVQKPEKKRKRTLSNANEELNESEKKQINKNIEKLKEDLRSWETPKEIEKNKEQYINKKKYMEYSNRLYREIKPNFYKFKRGRYKRFFVLGNNCVMVANRIIGKTLKEKFKFYGILTPGTYYDYLDREFMKKNSIVVSKKIYSKTNINDL